MYFIIGHTVLILKKNILKIFPFANINAKSKIYTKLWGKIRKSNRKIEPGGVLLN